MSVCRRPCEEDCEGFEGRPVQKCGVQEAQLEQVLLKLGMALEEAQNAATQPCFSAGVLCNEDGYISHLDLGLLGHRRASNLLAMASTLIKMASNLQWPPT